MSIKTKLSLGLFSVFLVVGLLAGLGAFYIKRLVNESKEIIKDNYESVRYAKEMLYTLDEMNQFYTYVLVNNHPDSVRINKDLLAQQIFRKNLNLELNNITEIGEGELAIQIGLNFQNYLTVR
jgi:hypothetical protein